MDFHRLDVESGLNHSDRDLAQRGHVFMCIPTLGLQDGGAVPMRPEAGVTM